MIFITIFISLFINLNTVVLGCSDDPKIRASRNVSLLEAEAVRFAYVGRVVVDDANQLYLSITKSWSPRINKKFIKNSGCNPLEYKEGELYLMLSDKSDDPEFFGHLNVDELDTGSTIDVYKVINKLATNPHFQNVFNPSWQFCKKNSDCKTLKDECNENVGINPKYEKAYNQFKKSRINTSEKNCNSIAQSHESKCIEHFCKQTSCSEFVDKHLTNLSGYLYQMVCQR